jgi:rhamnulokinase
LPEPSAYAAIDLGASSGRVFTGSVSDGCLTMREVCRFPNRPVRLPDGLHWDLAHLFSEALDALAAAGHMSGVGVDAWGVDYGLLDSGGHLLGLPYHYRNPRTKGMIERAFTRVDSKDTYAVTGIQVMPINTLFQLLAEEGQPAWSAADRIALIPDLLTYWLSGELVNERTVASTTGLLDAHSGEWASELIDRLGLRNEIFGELADPGTTIGEIRPEYRLSATPVHVVAGHDTASAFIAAPVRDRYAAILSSGTWSTLGVELAAPVLTDEAREANLTNELGVDGTTRLLKNVMGLWLEQECARAWGADHGELYSQAEAVTGEVPVFDPDQDCFLAPGDMPELVAAACERTGQGRPANPGETVRSILVSLACKYRLVLEQLERVTGRDLKRIHVIGGGARIGTLCRLTANVTRREVLAGPVEATAVGNVLVQARAAGEFDSLDDARAITAASAEVISYSPQEDAELAQATYERFLEVTRLRAPARA